ncbi:uncharacterized protein [Clinocottus analis]|uniref:uncharacterized protein isoform X2 n=1 Tax=Clinocottus analis TaxID=304258 RepID=UPI0035BF6025
MPDYCAAIGCSNERSARTKQQDITFHSRHFKSKDFDKTGQITRLKRGAIPSFPPKMAKYCVSSTEDEFSKTILGIKKRKMGTGKSILTSSSHANHVPCKAETPEKYLGSKSSILRIVERRLPHADHDYHQIPPSLKKQKEQLQEARKTIACQKEELVKLRKNRFFLERFQCDDRLIMFYTGFRDYMTLMAVFMALQPTAESMLAWSQDPQIVKNGFKEQSLPLTDQFFLFLCHLRQGFLLRDLAIRFNVSETSVSRICNTWTNFLYCMLGSTLVWPSRKKVNELMPLSLKKTFPCTRVIVDCTELHVKRAPSEVLQSDTYSHYKGTVTLKSLVGISPYGELTFISDLYIGSISDKEITQSSGLLSLLEEGDEVMADKDFLVRDILSPINVGLVIPASSKSNRQLTPEEELQTQDIARFRLHVERAIRRIKEYHIFDVTLPMTTLGSINQVWKVCALLTTFQGPLF